jgi:hypothetical protein
VLVYNFLQNAFAPCRSISLKLALLSDRNILMSSTSLNGVNHGRQEKIQGQETRPEEVAHYRPSLF